MPDYARRGLLIIPPLLVADIKACHTRAYEICEQQKLKHHM